MSQLIFVAQFFARLTELASQVAVLRVTVKFDNLGLESQVAVRMWLKLFFI